MSAERGHQALVVRSGKVTAWLVECPTCGTIGVPQDFFVDATAIRDRHAAVGGVERACEHEESLYGRCVACGMTWEEQAAR